MSRLSLIAQQVQTTYSTTEGMVSSLENVRRYISSMQQRVASLRTPALTRECDDVIQTLNHAAKRLEIAVLQLQRAIVIGKKWIACSVSSGSEGSTSGSGQAGSQAAFVGGASSEIGGNPLAGVRRIEGEHSIYDDLKATNRNYCKGSDAWTKNCQRCVIAYEMRRQGYDVEALPYFEEEPPFATMNLQTGFSACFIGGAWVDCADKAPNPDYKIAMAKVVIQMEEWGDGARAIVAVGWQGSDTDGHVFIAEQHGDRTIFIDPQNDDSDVLRYFQIAREDKVFCMRIDNLEVTDTVHRCCRERGKAL